MDEDVRLNQLVKDALESRPSFELRPVGRHRVGWIIPPLLAASVALVAMFNVNLDRDECSVENVICLLSEAEDVAVEPQLTASPEALLLAWQDASLSH